MSDKMPDEALVSVEDMQNVRDDVLRMVTDIDRTYFKLAEKLAEIAGDGFYSAWGYDTFDEYVEGELGFGRRKAYYYIGIYKTATDLGIDAEALEELGWTKAKEILNFVETIDDYEDWADRAKTMSVSQLQAAIKSAITGKVVAKRGKDEDGNKTFEHDGELFHVLEVPLSDLQYKNVRLALQRAGEIAGSDKANHLLDLMALDFLSTNSEVSDLGEKLADWVARELIEVEGSEEESDE